MVCMIHNACLTWKKKNKILALEHCVLQTCVFTFNNLFRFLISEMVQLWY